MKKNNNNNTTINHKSKIRINIGIIIFLFILIYLIIRIYIPFTKEGISVYVVSDGTIYLKKSYEGLIVRDEKCIFSDKSGFVNYYIKSGSRVAKNDNICSVGNDLTLYNKMKTNIDSVALDSSDFKQLKKETKKIYAGSSDFKNFYENSDTLANYYRKLIDLKLFQSIDEIVYNTGISADFNIIKSEFSGIVSYSIDGYENINETNFSNDSFDSELKITNTYENREITAGAPLYKIIASENWKIIIRLDNDIYKIISEKESISFCINNEREINAPVYFAKCGDNYFAIVTMEQYLINYSDERFLNITFDTEESTGIKIPVSALCYKDFYRIPDEYFSIHTDSNKNEQTGLILEKTDSYSGEKKYYFVETDIFLEEEGFKYISGDKLDSGEYICTKDYDKSTMAYLFNVRLCGAYNINNGYSVFKRLEIIETGQDYVIAKKDSASGISMYDHIALNASEICEGEIIY